MNTQDVNFVAEPYGVFLHDCACEHIIMVSSCILSAHATDPASHPVRRSIQSQQKLIASRSISADLPFSWQTLF